MATCCRERCTRTIEEIEEEYGEEAANEINYYQESESESESVSESESESESVSESESESEEQNVVRILTDDQPDARTVFDRLISPTIGHVKIYQFLEKNPGVAEAIRYLCNSFATNIKQDRFMRLSAVQVLFLYDL